MGRRAIIGIVLAGALVASALGAGIASAAPPEFVVSGSFPDAFTVTSKGAVLETVGGTRGSCKAATGSGEVTGPKSLLATLTWTGCKQAGTNCQNTNTAGVIVTETLAGTLGYIKLKPKVVGIDLSSPTGGLLVGFTCGEDVTVDVSGSVIGKIPLGKEPLQVHLAQKAGHQHFTSMLGGPVDVPMASVLGGPLQEAGIASTGVPVFSAPLKIVA